MPSGSVVANAYVQIVPTAQGIASAITSALTPHASAAGKSAGESMSSSLLSSLNLGSAAVMGAFASIGSKALDAIQNTVGAGISRIDTLESFKRVMTSLGESDDTAADAIDKIKSSLDGLPTSTADIASFAQQIKATGVSLEDSTDYALAFNNAMLAGGKGQEAANAAADAYNKIMATGKPYMNQWLTLVRTAPAQVDQLAKSLLGAEAGQNDLYEALQNGELSMEDFNRALVQLNEEGGENFANFEEQARAATGGIQTSLDLIGSRIGQQWYKIFDAIGQTNISGALNAFSSQFNKFGDIAVKGIDGIKSRFANSGILESVAESFSGAVEAYQPILDALGEAATAFGENFAETFGFFGRALGNFTSTLAELLPDIIGPLGELGSAFLDLFAGRIANALEALTPLLEPLGAVFGAIVEVLTTFIEISTDVLDVFVEGFLAGLEAFDFSSFTSAMSELGATISGVLEAISPYLEDVAYFFGEALGVALGAGLEMLGNFVSWLTAEGLPIIEQVLAWIDENVRPAIENIFTLLEETIIPAVQDFVANLGESLSPVLEQIATFIMENVVPALQEFGAWAQEHILPMLQDLAAFIMDDVVPALQDLGAWFGEEIAPHLEEFFGWIADNIMPVLEDLATFIIDNIVPAMKSMADWFGENILPTLKDLVKFFAENLQPAFEGLCNFLSDTFGPILEWIGGLFADLGAWWNSLWEEQPSVALPAAYPSGAFATGGLVQSPTYAKLAERGTELVWPSEGVYLNKYADAITASMERQGASKGGSGVSISNCTFNVRKQSDIRETAIAIDQLVNREKRGRVI